MADSSQSQLSLPLRDEEFVMHVTSRSALVLASCAALAVSVAVAASSVETSPEKYDVKIPGGLAFSEFKGYENWETIAVSHNGGALALIMGNPAMIGAFKSGVPGNGKPFPDGARMAKVHWAAVKSETEPGNPVVPGGLANVDFMVKDSKRFSDTGGWGYAVFEYDGASGKFRPGDLSSTPPQANDAKCGFACHTLVKDKDYVFTSYQKR
jgi:hypothetical protein